MITKLKQKYKKFAAKREERKKSAQLLSSYIESLGAGHWIVGKRYDNLDKKGRRVTFENKNWRTGIES